MPIPTSRIPGLFEHLGFDTGMQGKRGRHPANPATDNQDLHRFASKNAASDGVTWASRVEVIGRARLPARAWVTSLKTMINQLRESRQAARST